MDPRTRPTRRYFRKTKNNQARLRLVPSDDFDKCNSCSFSAASPLGSTVLPHSISLTEEGAKPTNAPISASVSPVSRSSEMRDAHDVMSPSLRAAVEISQRLPVTALRDNFSVPRPPEMPKNLVTIGNRVRWWRKKRGISRKDLAKTVDYSYSGLADLENDRSDGSEKLHLIAAKLSLNPHYLESGDGEPEAEFPQDPPPMPDEWPFPAVPRSRLKRLNKIERNYAETKLLEALAEIETVRRSRTG